MKQAIIYARFSPRPNPELCTSIEFQVDKCKSFCEAKDFDQIAVYSDAGKSGKTIRSRPGFEQAMIHVCKIKGVLVAYHLNRISRGIIDSVKMCESLEKNGADLAVVTQSFDTTTAAGRFFFYVMCALGQMQREEAAEWTTAKLKAMREKGLRVSREPRYGYKLDPNDPKKVIKDPIEQQLIKQVLLWRKQGKTYRRIVELIEKEGYRARGREWNPGSIFNLVKRHGPKEL
jgi:site-specific DNA recombinase